MRTKPTKYTKEYVLKEVKAILSEVEKDENIVFIGEFAEKRAFYRELWSEWANKFIGNKEISQTIKKVDSILEQRVNSGGLKNKLNATMVIFNLKNNYGWKDKSEQEVTGNISFLDALREAKKIREKEND